MVDTSYGWFDVGLFDVAMFDYPLDKSTTKQLCITSDITTEITINSVIKKSC